MDDIVERAASGLPEQDREFFRERVRSLLASHPNGVSPLAS